MLLYTDSNFLADTRKKSDKFFFGLFEILRISEPFFRRKKDLRASKSNVTRATLRDYNEFNRLNL